MQKDEMSFVIGPRSSHFVLSYVYGAPKTAGAQVLGKQVLRSATSIEANYPGSNRVRSKAEFITKWGDFLRDIEETAYWPESIADVGIVAAEKLMLLRHEWSQRKAARHRRQPEIGERPGQREAISRPTCDVCDNPKATKEVVST